MRLYLKFLYQDACKQGATRISEMHVPFLTYTPDFHILCGINHLLRSMNGMSWLVDPIYADIDSDVVINKTIHTLA